MDIIDIVTFVTTPAQLFVDLCYLHSTCAIYFLIFIVYKGFVCNNYLHYIFTDYKKIKNV